MSDRIHNPSIAYRPEIDGLRAVAVVPVILFHAGVDRFQGGFVGVDVFFVISGYLITSIIAKEIGQGRFTLRRFYERRARRILPALIFVLAICFVAAWVVLLPDQLMRFGSSMLAVATFISNLYFWQTTDYFGPAQEEQPLLHTWSLAVEEQYYVIFPLLLLWCCRFGKTRVVSLIAWIALISFGWSEWASRHAPVANFYLLPSRAWELLAGSLLAYIPADVAQRARNAGRTATIASVAGLCLIGYAIFVFDKDTPVPGVYAVAPVAGAVLVIAFSSPRNIAGRLLASRPFVAVGLISYSAYLWHQPLLAFGRILYLSAPPRAVTLALAALSLVLAALTFKFVEVPFRSQSEKPARLRLLTASALALAMVATLGIAARVSYGWPSRLPPSYAAVDWAGLAEVNHGLDPACDHQHTFVQTAECTSGNEPRVLLWGDSFAMHLADGLQQAGIDFMQATKSVCGPSFHDSPVPGGYYNEAWARDCLEFNRSVKRFLEQSPGQIEWVVMASPFGMIADGELFDGLRTYSPTSGQRFATFTRTVSDLRNLGIRPVLVTPPPTILRNVAQCLERRAAGLPVLVEDFEPDCSFAEALSIERSRERLQRLDELIVMTQVETVRLPQLMCTQGSCAASVMGVPLYKDAGHLSRVGSVQLEALYHPWRTLLAHESKAPAPERDGSKAPRVPSAASKSAPAAE